MILTPNKAICELCDEPVKCLNNTTNLLTHLKRHHFIQHEEIISEIRKEDSESVGNSSTTSIGMQQSLMEMILRKEAYKRDSARYAACQSALVFFICDDLQPISVVDSPAFHQLLHTLDPKFLPYSRCQFSRVIMPQKYEEVRHTVKQALDGVEYLSLTTDLWTGCHICEYMSLSVHFVSSDWDMGHYCLQTHKVASSHTALNLANELRNSMEEWEITDKVVMVTTDNGQNIRNATTEEQELSHLVALVMHCNLELVRHSKFLLYPVS